MAILADKIAQVRGYHRHDNTLGTVMHQTQGTFHVGSPNLAEVINECITDLKLSGYQYQPSGEGGTRSPPALPHRLQNQKLPGDPKMANRVQKGVYPQVFGHSKNILLNKFIDPSIPSMRKGCNGGEKNRGGGGNWWGKKKRLMKIRATGHYVIASSRSPNAAGSCQFHSSISTLSGFPLHLGISNIILVLI